MSELIYNDLVRFYHLLDPLEDHKDEVDEFSRVLRAAVPDATRLLELGSGAGHGAHFIKTLFDEVVLTDLSPSMLARSRELNPDCEHLLGDMRTLRVERLFDCVIAHDAIAYITSRDDLLATARTAFVHLRSGGAALFVPDCLKDSFKESHEDHAGDEGDLGLRCIAWSYDPDPDDDTHLTDFAFLLRERGDVRPYHDRHVYGLFSQRVWMETFTAAGFVVEPVLRPLPAEYTDRGFSEMMFLCRKPR